jgi:hypothetical protein
VAHGSCLSSPKPGKRPELTLRIRPHPAQLPQRNNLPLNIPVPIHQHRRRVLIRISFNTKIRAHLAKLDVPKLPRQLPPNLDEHARLDICSLGRCEQYEDVRFLRCFGYVARVVGFLEVVDLVVDRGRGYGVEFGHALLSEEWLDLRSRSQIR